MRPIIIRGWPSQIVAPTGPKTYWAEITKALVHACINALPWQYNAQLLGYNELQIALCFPVTWYLFLKSAYWPLPCIRCIRLLQHHCYLNYSLLVPRPCVSQLWCCCSVAAYDVPSFFLFTLVWFTRYVFLVW